VEHEVARLFLWPYLVKQMRQRHAGPFTDAAPALDAIVTGDLSPRRHRAQLFEAELSGSVD